MKKQATLPSLTKIFIASHLSGGVNCLSNVIEVKMLKHTSAIDVKTLMSVLRQDFDPKNTVEKID